MKTTINPLSSKQFWITIITLIFTILVAFVPALEQHIELLVSAATVIVGFAIGGFTIQDVAKAKFDNLPPSV